MFFRNDGLLRGSREDRGYSHVLVSRRGVGSGRFLGLALRTPRPRRRRQSCGDEGFAGNRKAKTRANRADTSKIAFLFFCSSS